MRTGIRLRLLAALGLTMLLLAPAGTAHAGVDDFSYASWTSEYIVTMDTDGRAHAHVTETLVARFPEFDQNRGIVRGLAERYEGAGLGLRIESVTDERGQPVPYETESDEGTLYVALGDDDYVHGLTTYVIEYTMRDVILAATETGNDEFYWNLLPLNSRQPVEQFEGRVTLAPELAAHLTGDVACYEGFRGSTQRCEMTQESLPDGSARFSISASGLAAGYGFTPAIGMTAGTVTQPSARLPNPVADFGPMVMLGGGALTAAGGAAAVAAFRRRKRTATGIIVAQYDVPDTLPPLVAAAVYPGARDVIPAEIVHLAVRGVLRIEEDGGTGKRKKGQQPVLRLLNPDGAPSPLDARMVGALFPQRAVHGTFRFPKSSDAFAKKMRAVQAAGKTAATKQGLLTKERSGAARVLFWVAAAFVAAAVVFAMIGAITGREEGLPILIVSVVGGALLLVVCAALAARKIVHTRSGAGTFEYLQGVREFIRVAEADRLRMLQSVHGAERYHSGSAEIVHLYERLLPYAMLFGEERSWGRVLEMQYEASDSTSAWFVGFHTGSFSSHLSSMSSAMQTSATYSSSSSGGSSGGGSSGGGGGGGSSGGR